MSRALTDFTIKGVATTIPFHRNIMAHDAFRRGETSTVFLPNHPEVLDVAPAAQKAHDPEGAPVERPLRMLVEVAGRRLDVAVSGLPGLKLDGATDASPGRRRRGRGARKTDRKPGGNDLTSPGQGTVLRVEVQNGQQVSTGDLICVIEAMKMENEMVAHRDGVIANLSVEAGDSIGAGVLIASIEDAPAT
jgi:acetyl-CoA/propionyl-CoA carboxylase biotin carboxyl carrier protein